MKKILQKILALLAKAIIKKYRPKIVGITGSIGKTSAKEAAGAVLSMKFRVRQNLKNYNNELGVPLTIIGRESGGKSPVRWLGVFSSAFKLILFKDEKYPEVLLLEMGADKPGDIEYLLGIAPVDIGVVTKIGPAHLEFFRTVENIAKEKSKIISSLKNTGFAILNYDDPFAKKMADKTKARVIFFGQGGAAEVRSIDLDRQVQSLDFAGIKFKISYKGSTVPVFLPNVIGNHQINSALIGAAVGIALNMNLIEISEGLKNYQAPKGRMNLILGMNNSLIVDDTYNSSPEAAIAAIEAVANLNIGYNSHKIAALGDMLELGEISETAHCDLGAAVAKAGFQTLVCVGNFKEAMAKGAKDQGLLNIEKYDNSIQAADALKTMIQPGSIVLVKGSQGVRMERVVKAIMLNPADAERLLVRQGEEWKK